MDGGLAIRKWQVEPAKIARRRSEPPPNISVAISGERGFDYEYNTTGRLRTLTYPSGFQVTYSYTIGGKLNKIRRSDDNSLIYRANARNKYCLTTRCEYGNGVATEYEYNPHGLITRIQTGNKALLQPEEDPDEETFDLWDQPMIPPYTVDSAFLNYRYAYDDRGLIVSRSERVIDYREDYKYDNLDRLTGITSGSVGAVSAWQGFSYLPNGNFETNSALGVYAYQNNEFGMLKAHAVSEIALTGNNNSPGLHDVTYNFFNQPTQIKEDKYRLDLFYGANQQRQKVERYFDDVKETTRYYINKHYEQEDDHATKTTSRYHYIYGDNGVVALYITTGPTSNGGGGIGPHRGTTENMYYIHTDHLGSYCAITDEGKNVVQRSFFDPWGNVVDLKLSLNFAIIDRGFTGHEHYPKLKIINMNGRLYDPVIARFFSPDKYVANSSFTQDFNRYTYARNNPLMYTDPDGEWIHIVVGAIIGGVFNVITNWSSVKGDWGKGAVAFFAGAASGALTATHPALGIVGSAITSTTNNIIQQTGKGFSGNIDWNSVGVSAMIGVGTGIMSYGIGQAISSTGVTDKILDVTGITNKIARNLIGSSINGAITNTATGLATGTIASAMSNDWSQLWQHTWKGFTYGAVGGLVQGGLMELGYQAQLKWGRNNGLNSQNTEAIASGFDDGINQFNNSGSQSRRSGEIEVIYNTQTQTTMVYPNIPSNGYWQPPTAPYPYSSPNIPGVFLNFLRLYW